MAKIIMILASVALVGVVAEPPSPQRYLPPGQGHNGYPRGNQQPPSNYGVPAASSRYFSQYSAPSSQYGAPVASNRASTQYSAPSSQYNGPSAQYGAPSSRNGNGGSFSGYQAARGGYNNQDNALAEPANYEFSYEVQDDEHGNNFGHQESRQGDEARGSYHVLLPDGRTQVVDYVANNEGFTPTIRYDEAQGGYPSGPRGRQGGYSGSGSRGNQGPY